ncbi:hypothetical protein T07_14494 [Trichinella nelsoni]|uniref:Uncharacterized protein n=1 Tax=Trichinella nelsoni TaxID=6336 RepID=A0A0V0RL02_9BILA|nr:hypothetical protein T07_14494 [Trichinella nelsoni]
MADGFKAMHASNKCVEMMAILCCERQLREVVKYLMNFSFYTLEENLFRDIRVFKNFLQTPLHACLTAQD